MKNIQTRLVLISSILCALVGTAGLAQEPLRGGVMFSNEQQQNLAPQQFPQQQFQQQSFQQPVQQSVQQPVQQPQQQQQQLNGFNSQSHDAQLFQNVRVGSAAFPFNTSGAKHGITIDWTRWMANNANLIAQRWHSRLACETRLVYGFTFYPNGRIEIKKHPTQFCHKTEGSPVNDAIVQEDADRAISEVLAQHLIVYPSESRWPKVSFNLEFSQDRQKYPVCSASYPSGFEYE